MHGGTHKHKDKRRDNIVRQTDFWLELMSIFGVSAAYAVKEFFAVFNVFRMSVYLIPPYVSGIHSSEIHKAVFLSVFFCCPVRNF